MEQVYWLFVEAFALAFLLMYFLLAKAARVGLVDWPKSRKRSRSIPLIGGLAIYLTYVMVCGPTDNGLHSPLLVAGGGILVLIGALDDYFDFPPTPRLVAQVLAALCLPLAGVMIHDLGAMTLSGQTLSLGLLAVPFTLFATVGMINAFNMSDGIDGLSGSLSLIALLGLGVIALAAGQIETTASLVVLAGATGGFLAYNLRTPLRRSAAAFLGDSGSMLLGFALTWFLVSMSQGQAAAMTPICAVWLVALPLVDTVFSILRRTAARQSPLAPDNRHLHHLLLRTGLGVGQTVATLAAVATLLAGIGMAGAIFHWSQLALALSFAALFGVYCLGATIAWRLIDRHSAAPADRPELVERGSGRLPRAPSTADGWFANRGRARR